MSTYVQTGENVLLGHVDLTDHAHGADFGPITANMVPFPSYGDGGYECFKPGIKRGVAVVRFHQDYDAGVLEDQFTIDELGTRYPFTVIPNPTGTIAAGDTAWISRGVNDRQMPLGAAIGAAADGELSVVYDTRIVQAVVAAPSASITGTTSGTAIALTGPTATQDLYCALHVTAWDSLTNIVFKVQSDDNSGFSSATDRITFTTATDVTSEWKSVGAASDLSTETHWRILATVTGTGSATFAAAFGVI